MSATTTARPAGNNSKPRPKQAPRRWGADGDRVLERLQKRRVEVKLADGEILRGGLAGYSEYQITLAMEDNGLWVVNKGQIVWLRPWRNGDNNGPRDPDEDTNGGEAPE